MLKRGLVAALVAEVVTLCSFGVDGPVLTRVIYQATAYTLPTGVWELEGTFSLPVVGLSWASLSYSLTENIQASTRLTADLFGMPNSGIKLALGRTGPVALAASAGVTYFPQTVRSTWEVGYWQVFRRGPWVSTRERRSRCCRSFPFPLTPASTTP